MDSTFEKANAKLEEAIKHEQEALAHGRNHTGFALSIDTLWEAINLASAEETHFGVMKGKDQSGIPTFTEAPSTKSGADRTDDWISSLDLSRFGTQLLVALRVGIYMRRWYLPKSLDVHEKINEMLTPEGIVRPLNAEDRKAWLALRARS